jgi:hypothetical protein
MSGDTVVFEVDGVSVLLAHSSAALLAEKLRNYAAGRYDRDVADLAKLGTDPVWLEGARAAADAIEDVLTETRPGPVPLDSAGKAAGAVYAVLRLTGPVFSDATSDVAQLHAVLDRNRP